MMGFVYIFLLSMALLYQLLLMVKIIFTEIFESMSKTIKKYYLKANRVFMTQKGVFEHE
jgi:hypothetical protein